MEADFCDAATVEVPTRYVLTANLFAYLAACRANQDPFGPWFSNLSHGEQAVAIAVERAMLLQVKP